jgi:hypothetical protein
MAWLWRRDDVPSRVELARSPVRHGIGLRAHKGLDGDLLSSRAGGSTP